MNNVVLLNNDTFKSLKNSNNIYNNKAKEVGDVSAEDSGYFNAELTSRESVQFVQGYSKINDNISRPLEEDFSSNDSGTDGIVTAQGFELQSMIIQRLLILFIIFGMMHHLWLQLAMIQMSL